MGKTKELPKSSPENPPERQKVLADATAERNRLRDSLAQADQSTLVIDFLQTKEGSEYVLHSIIESLKSAKAPKPMIDLIQRDFVEPLARANETLSKSNESLERKIPVIKQRLADSKKLHENVLGFKSGEVRIDDAQKMQYLKNATDWVCTYSSKKALDDAFGLQRKLLSKDENAGKIELSEQYIRDMQTFDVTRPVQEFRKAGWSEPICKQFEETLRKMIKEAITVETAKVEFLKKTKK